MRIAAFLIAMVVASQAGAECIRNGDRSVTCDAETDSRVKTYVLDLEKGLRDCRADVTRAEKLAGIERSRGDERIRVCELALEDAHRSDIARLGVATGVGVLLGVIVGLLLGGG